ncbi:MAG: HAMP domain-containing sensor histidine kinase [Anaerolineales bacterium]
MALTVDQWETTMAQESVSNATHPDRQELRRQITQQLGLTIALVGAVAALIVLPGPNFRRELFTAFLLAAAAGWCAQRWCSAHPRWASATLAVGLWASFALALFTLPGTATPYVGGLIVLVHAAIDFRLGLASAGVVSAVLLAWGDGNAALAPIAGAWLTLICQWISSRAQVTALNWVWSSQERANQLLSELRTHRGELARTVEALTEATRRLQRTGYQLQIARLRAEELRDIKTTFAANISHELRTPLNLILGFTETMYYRPEVYGRMRWPVALRRDISHIYQASRQLQDLVNDVLDLSRLDAVQMPITREWVDLREVVAEAEPLLMFSDYEPLQRHTPALVLNRYGRGAAVYMAAGVGEAYTKMETPYLRQVVERLLEHLGVCRPVTVEGLADELSQDLEIMLLQSADGRDRTIVAINHGDTAATATFGLAAGSAPRLGLRELITYDSLPLQRAGGRVSLCGTVPPRDVRLYHVYALDKG